MWRYAAALFVLWVPHSFTRAVAAEPTPLEAAVAAGTVTVSFRGAGASTGDAIFATVENRGKTPLVLSLPAGLILQNEMANVQDMVVRKLSGKLVSSTQFAPASEIQLGAREKAEWVMEAYCLEFKDANPSADSVLRPVAVSAELARLFAVGASTPATQAAVWAYTDDISARELLGKFPVSESALSEARRVYESTFGGACGRRMFMGGRDCPAGGTVTAAKLGPYVSPLRPEDWVPVPVEMPVPDVMPEVGAVSPGVVPL